MGNPTFNTRIQHKRGTTEDWGKALNFTPLPGELIIYHDEGKSPMLKIGDGKTLVGDLPWAQDFANVIIGIEHHVKMEVEPVPVINPLYGEEGQEQYIIQNHVIPKTYIEYTLGSGTKITSTDENIINIATDVTPGIVYLYNTTGSSTVGAMTQKATTEELVKKVEGRVEGELAIFENTTKLS